MIKYFYDTEVLIENAENAGSYSSDTEYTAVCTVMADVQPYRTDGVQSSHGIYKDVQLVMYCQNDDKILVGMRAVIAGERYIITGIEKRRLGMKIYLKEAIAE